MTKSAACFERDRYVLRPALLTEPSLTQTYRYACTMADKGYRGEGDVQVPGTPAFYGDFVMERLLNKLLPDVEAASGLSLFPTYSYYRVYRNGDTLAPHRDRAACEISVTLCLGPESSGVEAGALWPIWIEGPQGVASVELHPGDALLYRGVECVHWREAFKGQRQAQVFLHYVDRNGPHAEWKYDKREATGLARL